MKIRTINLAALAALCLAFAAAPAAAKLVKLANGKTISIYPRPAPVHNGVSRNAPAGAHLDYHNGPVLHGDQTVAIYWDPAGSSFSSGNFEPLVNRYLVDTAHDSGTFGNDYSVATQYSDGSGGVQYQSSFLDSFNDTTAYPDDCVPNDPLDVGDHCVTDTAIQNRI